MFFHNFPHNKTLLKDFMPKTKQLKTTTAKASNYHITGNNSSIDFPDEVVLKDKKAKRPIQQKKEPMDFLLGLMQREYNDLPSLDKSSAWKYAAKPGVKKFYSNNKTGKWCINIPKESIDEAWKKVSLACAEGKLLVAKTSTALTANKFPNFLICVYTNNWEDMDDIRQTREVLYEIGFTQPLKYKRDIETINGVYNTPDEFYIVE